MKKFLIILSICFVLFLNEGHTEPVGSGPIGGGGGTGAGHNPVTIGTANGLSLVGQQVSLAAATAGTPGAATAAQITALEAIDTEAELETMLDLQDLQGAVTDGQIPATIARDSELHSAVTIGTANGLSLVGQQVSLAAATAGSAGAATAAQITALEAIDTEAELNAMLIDMPVELRHYAHWGTADYPYNDTSTPHVLTTNEVKGGLITNAGATQDRVYTCPAAGKGFNFMVMVVAAYQMDIEPDGTETLWLNGTQMAAGEHIINAADTKGDVMSCWSAETGDGTYEIFCKSDNSNFAEATP